MMPSMSYKLAMMAGLAIGATVGLSTACFIALPSPPTVHRTQACVPTSIPPAGIQRQGEIGDTSFALVSLPTHHIAGAMDGLSSQGTHSSCPAAPATRWAAPEHEVTIVPFFLMDEYLMNVAEVVVPRRRALPPLMERDDLRAYAQLGHLQALTTATSNDETHVRALCTTRSTGAAIDGMYAFWPASRRTMHTLFALSEHSQIPVHQLLASRAQVAAEPLVCESPTPEALAIAKQLRVRLAHALAGLPPQDYIVLRYTYDLEGRGESAGSLAVKLNVHRSTIHRRHDHIMRRLRAILLRPMAQVPPKETT